MSFRELRNFTEIMRSLGYPRLISMENFRQPNFELVADTLLWLAQRYDPSIDIVDDISTEADRVVFLKSISQLMAARGRIKLNMKRLYAADGYAVKELLKIASVLYKATSKANEKEELGAAEFALSTKAFDVKQTRQLASEITQRGAQLYDALESEHELRELRQKAITRNMDMDEIEACVHEAMAEVTEGIRETEKQMENLEKDEKNLDAKIEKRKAALEISEKRLNSLESVRPPYMDEYEKLQADLQHLYLVYLERFRNLQFLENELENFDRVEQEKMEESDRHLKKMQKRLREEEMRILRGETAADDSNIDFEMSDEEVEAKPRRKKKGKKGKKGGRGGRNVVGSLVGGEDSESEEDLTEDDGSDGSESTHVSLNDDESVDDLINDDDEDDLTDVDDDDDDDDEASSDNEF
uniref:Clusterin-associated protein 1 n=1 Tax=Pyramimonas obovata TaxID=1411642 RepID=A0A7S0RGA7_9CHLO|mmetsp:Transcript_33485/g.73079  ORF Transcript_33485/g.73079 Transcript_33485/m.73079 type:complete len:413 (+) Transcript_33485:160-1398(+)|eukprot:CAMPEP_0118924074 /NCGR_PEP_ID=MMETSP1169-20130426/2371_1 /TAXON_ID=36882 /ORGANISM="Pyramimonas obovata, Strain CCMP722" /LENGTH=412 /DNA_ID=CAMNT_0006865155 /DNA_START=160 /DNA_END=1398 /DNA_ORIENTATION=+